MHLTDFQRIRPEFETEQEQTLEWLAAAHSKASPEQSHPLREKLWHVACKPDRIAKRGHVIADFLHRDWNKMEVYRLEESASGLDLSTRTQIFSKKADSIFEQYYPEGAVSPADIFHVSCTGYASPSGAQKLVSKRHWGKSTTVTHMYHMGCYGAMAAIRIAHGLVKSKKKSVDIVHTEMCSLHVNPSLHATDQFVTQSLFADGFMKYTAVEATDKPHLQVINILEEIIPDSLSAMTWNVAGWGFQMSLAKEVAVLIKRHLVGFLERLCNMDIKNAYFAVHPGGPKILIHVKDLLTLTDEQMRLSFEILRDFGNMSSATLPHIWERILEDPNIPSHTPIISLAFGPGLTIAGAFMEKVCGS